MLREVVNSFKLVKSIIRSLAFDMSACMHLPMTALLGNKIYLRGNFISLSNAVLQALLLCHMYFHMCCILQKEFILHLLPSYFIQITLHMKYIVMGNECVTFVCVRLQFQHNNKNILFLRENNKPAAWKYSITITRKLWVTYLSKKRLCIKKNF